MIYQSNIIDIVKVKNGEKGDTGGAGLNSATVFLYLRTPKTTAGPQTPNIDVIYNFTTGVVGDGTGKVDSWFTSIPNGTDPCYITQATVISSYSTATIQKSKWQEPKILVENGAPGKDGEPGKDGQNGQDGQPGKDGENGKDGANGANGYNNAIIYLYRRSSIALKVDWTTSLTYTFSTSTLSSVPSGWSRSIPGGTDPLYVTAATASSQTNTAAIVVNQWTTPVIMAKDGADGIDGAPGKDGADGKDGSPGANGRNNATVYLYKRSATQPSINWTATLVYTFSTGKLSSVPSGWSQNIASGSDPLYVTAAIASSSTATDTISSSEWSTPVVLVTNGAKGQDGEPGKDGVDGKDGQDGAPGKDGVDGKDGSPGVNGLNQATIFLYKRSSTLPTKPSKDITYTFATGALSTTDGWSLSVPNGTNPCYVTQAVAIANTATTVIKSTQWSTPEILAKDGAPGKDGTDGKDGVDGKDGKDSERYEIVSSVANITKFLKKESSTTNTQAEAEETYLTFSPPVFLFTCNNKVDGVSTIIQGDTVESLPYKLNIDIIANNVAYVLTNDTFLETGYLLYQSSIWTWNFAIEKLFQSGASLTFTSLDGNSTISLAALCDYAKENDITFRVRMANSERPEQGTSLLVPCYFGISSEMAQLELNATNLRLFVENTGIQIDRNGLTLENGTFQIVKGDKKLLYTSDNGDLVISGRLASDSIISGNLQAVTGTFKDLSADGRLKVGKIIIESYVDENGSRAGRIYNDPNEDGDPTDSNFLILDNGNIKANNIALGTGASIEEFLAIGNAKIYNPAKSKEKNLFIESNALKIYDDGRAAFGDISINSSESTIICTKNGIGQWGLTPNESYFNNVAIRGYLKQSVFTKQAVNVAGGVVIYKAGARIENSVISENSYVIQLQKDLVDNIDYYSYFSIGDIILLSQERNGGGNAYGKITKVNSDSLEIAVIGVKIENPEIITNLGRVDDNGDGQDWIIGINATTSEAPLGLSQNAISFNSFSLNDDESALDFTSQIRLGHLSTGESGLFAEKVHLKGSLVTESGKNDQIRYSGVNTLSPQIFNKDFSNYIVKSDDETTPLEGVTYYIFSSDGSGFIPVEDLVTFDSSTVYYKKEKDNSPIIFWAGAQNESQIQDAPFQVTAKGTLYAQQGYFRGSIITDADISASIIRTARIVGNEDGAALTIEDSDNFIRFVDSKAKDSDGNPIEVLSLKKNSGGQWVMDLNALFQMGSSSGDFSAAQAVFDELYVGKSNSNRTYLNGKQIDFLSSSGGLIGELRGSQDGSQGIEMGFTNVTLLGLTQNKISVGTTFDLNAHQLTYNEGKMYDRPVYQDDVLVGYDLYII